MSVVKNQDIPPAKSPDTLQGKTQNMLAAVAGTKNMFLVKIQEKNDTETVKSAEGKGIVQKKDAHIVISHLHININIKNTKAINHINIPNLKNIHHHTEVPVDHIKNIQNIKRKNIEVNGRIQKMNMRKVKMRIRKAGKIYQHLRTTSVLIY